MTLAKGFAYFAATCWAFVLVGATAMALGDPQGINAVIGAGVPAVIFTIGACIERHTGRRQP